MSEALTTQQIGFPDAVIAILQRPIPNKALSQAPRGMTSIKSIYISERLNEAFGLGRWHLTDEVVDRTPPTLAPDGKKELPAMIVVKARLSLPDYPWFEAWAYGGNNNPDLGDAYKGAVSDALSKIAAVHLNVALEVFKGQAVIGKPDDPPPAEAPKALSKEVVDERVKLIENSENLIDLKKQYEEGYKIATAAKDANAIKVFTAAKDAKKKGWSK